jgi:hypothetical protein
MTGGAGGVEPVGDVVVEGHALGGEALGCGRLDPLVAVGADVAEVQAAGVDDDFHGFRL